MSKIKSILAFAALMLCGGAWAEPEMLYYFNMDNNDTNGGSAGVTHVSKSGNAYNFVTTAKKNGTHSLKSDNAAIKVEDTTNFIGTSETGWTVAFWFHPNGMGNWRDVCGFKLNTGNNNHCFKFEKTGANALQIYNNASVDGLGDAHPLNYTANSWNHIAYSLTEDKKGINLFVNGALVYEYKASQWESSGVPALKTVIMGANGLNDNRTSSALTDDWTIFNCSMNAGQISHLKDMNPPSADFLGTGAMIGETSYSTLSEAISVANASANKVTITLLKDTDVSVELGEHITLDVGGFKYTGAVSGSGTLIINKDINANTDTTVNLPAALTDSLKDSANWTGEVILIGGYDHKQMNSITNLCNASSKLTSKGNKGWLLTGSLSGIMLNLVDNGDTPALYISNSSQNWQYTIKGLQGDGTFKFNTVASSATSILVNDASNFRGNVQADNRPIYFGTSGSNGTRGLIKVNSGNTVTIDKGKTWTAQDGITIAGTIKGVGTLGSATTFEDGATVDLSDNGGDALSFAETADITFGGTLNLIGAEVGSVVFKNVSTQPYGLAAVEVTCGDKHGSLAWDSETQKVTFVAAASIWTPNPDAIDTNGVFTWGAENAWLDGAEKKTWANDTTQMVKIDANTVSGVKIVGQIAAGTVVVVNTSDQVKPIVFHNHTMGVNGDFEVNADGEGHDCLHANVDFAGFNGELGLRVPIDGDLTFGTNTHLKFLTGEDDNPSTAYGYAINSRAGAIMVGLNEGQSTGSFLVPESMYNLPFAPEANTKVVYNVAQDAEKTVTSDFSGAGTIVKKGAGTLIMTADVAAGTSLTVSEGTLKYSTTVSGGFKGTLNVEKGAIFFNRKLEDLWNYDQVGIAINVWGTFDLDYTRINVNSHQAWNIYGGATIHGYHQSGSTGNKSFDFADGNGLVIHFHADPTGEDNTIIWDAISRFRYNDVTFDVDDGVTVVVQAEQNNYGGARTLTKTGLGTLKFIATEQHTGVIYNNVTVNAGLLDLSELTDGSEVLKQNLTVGANGHVKFPSGVSSFAACNGTLTGVSGGYVSDGSNLQNITIDGHNVNTASVDLSGRFNKEGQYWKNVYTGPEEGGTADASIVDQWKLRKLGTTLAPQLDNCNNWQSMLFDGNIVRNVATENNYKTINVSKPNGNSYAWVGWALEVGVANGAKVVVDSMNYFQTNETSGDMFIGVDSSSKFVINEYKSGNNAGKAVVDIAAPEGLEIGSEAHPNFSPSYINTGDFEYYFRGTGNTAGSIKINGTFNIGDSHQVKYVEISKDEIGEGQYDVVKERKLIGFGSSTLGATNVMFAEGATIEWIGYGESEIKPTTVIKSVGQELSAMDEVGAAQIVKKDDGIYLQWMGKQETLPSRYEWLFTQTTGNWSGVGYWKGLYNDRQLTWGESYEKTVAGPAEEDNFVTEDGATYLKINKANDFYFYFNAANSQSVVVDTAIAESTTGHNVNTGVEGTGHRYIKVIGEGTFKFNLPKGSGVDSEGAPEADFNWNNAVALDVPVDASAFVGELGLRAKITKPITLGSQTKIVFVKPDAGVTTKAYNYVIENRGGSIEARGPGNFIVPTNMYDIPFEVYGNDRTTEDAGYIVYEVPTDTTWDASGDVSGKGGIIKDGAGTLTLSGTLTCEKGITVKAGILRIPAKKDGEKYTGGITVLDGAKVQVVVPQEMIETGYSADNVTIPDDSNGTVEFVNAEFAALENHSGEKTVLSGTEDKWVRGNINGSYITDTPLAILYNLTIAELKSRELKGKLAGGDWGGISGAGEGKIVVAVESTTKTINGHEITGYIAQVQALDSGLLKMHEIFIWEGLHTDYTRTAGVGELSAIWAVNSRMIWTENTDEYGQLVTENFTTVTNMHYAYNTVMLWAKKPTTVARVNGVDYTLIDEAFAAALSDAATVEIVANISGDLVIPAGVQVNASAYAVSGIIQINDGAKLTISGDRTTQGILGAGMLIIESGSITANNKYGGYAIENTTVQINGGTLTINNGDNDPKVRNVTFKIGENGALTNHGWITLEGDIVFDTDYAKTIFAGGYSSFRGTSNIVKKGNGALTFDLYRDTSSDDNRIVSLKLNGGSFTLTKDNITIATVSSDVADKEVAYNGTTRTYSLITPVAKIGDIHYSSLALAITEAGSESTTIELVAACAENVAIPANVTVKTTSATPYTGCATGSGRIVFEGYLPEDISTTAEAFQNAAWTGTVEMKDYKRTDNANIIYFSKYANTGSTVALNNVTSTMFGNGVNNHHDQSLGALEIAQGGWTSTAEQYGNSPTYYANLRGSGTINVLQKGGGVVNFIGDHSAFCGKIAIDSTSGREVFLQNTGATKRTNNAMAGVISVGSGCEINVANGMEWAAPGGFKIDGTLKFDDDASGSHLNHWMNGSLMGSGTIDTSECTSANKNSQVRILFRGDNHSFDGTIKLKNHVHVVFTTSDKTATGMIFSDQGYVCVEHGTATLGATANWGSGGTGVLAWYDDAVLEIAGGTITGNLFMNSATTLSFPSLDTNGATITGNLVKNGGGKIKISLPTSASEEETTLLSFNSTSLTPSDFTITQGPTGFILAIEENKLKLKAASDITSAVAKEANNVATEGYVSIGEGGVYTVTGKGGLTIETLKLKGGSKIAFDPVRTPILAKTLDVSGATTIKLAGTWTDHANEYAEIECGKIHLLTYPNTIDLDTSLITIEGLKAGVDAKLKIVTVDDSNYKQLVLDIGDFENNAQTINISQFGDSITEGIWRSGPGTPNYRIPLMHRLEAHGYKPISYGYRGDVLKNNGGTVWNGSDANGVPADPNYRLHNGISAQRVYTGTRSGAIRAGFNESLEAHLEQVGIPDVITLKIGTNDLIGGQDGTVLYEGWSNLVARIVANRPTTRVVVTTVLKAQQTGDYANLNGAAATTYNEKITAAVNNKIFGENQVFLADLRTAVGDHNGTDFVDQVHPNWSNYNVMADTLFPVVTNAFATSTGKAHVPHTVRGAEANVPASYRKGFVKLASFDAVTGKISEWTSGVPYTYANMPESVNLKRVAYYVERKTNTSPDNRFVWVDMDPWKSNLKASESGIAVTEAQRVNTVIDNLHVYSNNTGIKNIEPTVSGTKGTLLFTDKYLGIAGQITTTGFDSVYGFDYNDTLDNGSDWGAMIVSRVDPDFATTSSRQLKGETLFSFNGYNAAAAKKNMLGIGSFAVHGPMAKGNDATLKLTMNWMFDKNENPQFTRMTADNLDFGTIEIWGVPEGYVVPDSEETIEVSAESAAAAIESAQIMPDTAAETAAGSAATRESYLAFTATRVGESNNWKVQAVVDNTKLPENKKIDDTAVAFANAGGIVKLAGATEKQTISIPAASVTPGLYYSVSFGTTPDNHTQESERVLATSGEGTVDIPVPALGNEKVYFIKIKASATK